MARHSAGICAMRYDAFISYSHAADNAAAPALQAALHAFARPWNQMRAMRVFRDQTSLAASPELWPAIEAALADSRWLLLMASPEAAGSRWVAREIDWWLKNRSASTLLIVLTGGALAWDEATGDFDWPRTTCLPRQALGGHLAGEPLWVDLSWAKSADVLTLRHARFRQAVLDVAAPLHGRPKDELDGDDVRRFAQVQRLRAGAIAALVGLTVLAAAAAWVATEQRNEARRQATIAQAGRLAVQADLLRERGGPVDPSVMLAAEALRRLDAIGERSADVDQALRRALAGLPESRGTLDLSADAIRLAPDGSLLIATQTGGQISARAVPDGSPRGCTRDAIEALRTPPANERQWLIDAVADDGQWCVLHAFLRDSNVHHLELWSAAPLRQVAVVTLPSQAGHVRPSVAAAGRWLAATDVPQSGDASAAVVRLWQVGADGRLGEPLTLPGMAVLAFSPDGGHLATSAGLWQLPPAHRNPEPQRRISWDAAPWKVAFSPDSAHLATQTGPDSKVVIWDLSSADDRLRASPPPGELLALSNGGARLVSAGGSDTTVWDTEFDVARATLPRRADAAALPGDGRAHFVATTTNRIGLTQQQLLTLAEDPGAQHATTFPGNVDGVRALRLGQGGDVDLIESRPSEAPAESASTLPPAAGDTIRIHRWSPVDGSWSVPATWEGVTAFAVGPQGRVAASAGGRVTVAQADGSAPPLALAPAVAADLLAFSGNAAHLLAHAGAPGGGALHVWSLTGRTHWSAPVADAPSAMTVTDDGRMVLAVVAHGESTRSGRAFRLLRWRITDAAGPRIVELGRRLAPPSSVCEVLLNAATAGTGDTGVVGADLAGCNGVAETGRWRIIPMDRQATILAPSGAAVARIDHASKVLQADVSATGLDAATLDESGRVQRFKVAAKNLIAQACARHPAPLSDALRASLSKPVETLDACGRAHAPEPPPAPAQPR